MCVPVNLLEYETLERVFSPPSRVRVARPPNGTVHTQQGGIMGNYREGPNAFYLQVSIMGYRTFLPFL